LSKIKYDKYYTEDNIAEYCVKKTFEVLGNKWLRIIEPAAGGGAYLKYLPETTLAYDIKPEAPGIVEQDYLKLVLPYMERSLVITNPPFGRANKLSIQFIKKSLEHSDYISLIQPISQLNNDNSVSGVDLVYSEDLGTLPYSGRPVHCCLNIYVANPDHKRELATFPGLIECRHIFRTGKYKHSEKILNTKWDFRVGAWGNIKLLEDDETCTNEVVFRCTDEVKPWLYKKLKECNYNDLISCVTTPNLPSWRLRNYLRDEWYKEEK